MIRIGHVFLRTALVGVALCLAALATVRTAHAQTSAPSSTTANQNASDDESSKVSASYDVLFGSGYLFQGLNYSDGNAVAQPNLSVGMGGFTFGAWGNFQPEQDVLNEIDLSLKYSQSFKNVSMSPGYTVLRYPNRDWDPSQEFFVDLAVTAPMNPTLSIHYDFDAGKGSYTTFGLSREVKAPITLATNLFYQSQYYEMTGVPAVEFKASAALSVGVFGFTPSLSRFVTWENGDFAGAAAVPDSWLLSVDFTHQLK